MNGINNILRHCANLAFSDYDKWLYDDKPDNKEMFRNFVKTHKRGNRKTKVNKSGRCSR